jgi:hypothetical protein
MNFFGALFFIALATSFAVAYIDNRLAQKRRATELENEKRLKQAA